MMMMSVLPHLEVVISTIENVGKSQRRNEAVEIERKIIKRKRVGKEIESITHLIVNQLMTKMIEKMVNAGKRITPLMMDRLLMKRGGERGGSDQGSVMIQMIVSLPTLLEVMIERKAKRERSTNQSPRNE